MTRRLPNSCALSLPLRVVVLALVTDDLRATPDRCLACGVSATVPTTATADA